VDEQNRSKSMLKVVDLLLYITKSGSSSSYCAKDG